MVWMLAGSWLRVLGQLQSLGLPAGQGLVGNHRFPLNQHLLRQNLSETAEFPGGLTTNQDTLRRCLAGVCKYQKAKCKKCISRGTWLAQ